MEFSQNDYDIVRAFEVEQRHKIRELISWSVLQCLKRSGAIL